MLVFENVRSLLYVYCLLLLLHSLHFINLSDFDIKWQWKDYNVCVLPGIICLSVRLFVINIVAAFVVVVISLGLFFPFVPQRENVEGVSLPPSDDVIRELSRSLREALGVSLFGIDVIINNQTGQHAVIDINAFPGMPFS